MAMALFMLPLLLLSASVFCDKGILITGGSDSPTSVELFLPGADQSCQLPQISGIRDNHSQCGKIVCGGDDYYARDDCVQMNEQGQWSEIGTTVEYRTDHICWSINGEILLMGGSYDEQSTENLNLESGVGQSGYRLQYPSRGACLIQDDLTLSAIVTAREAVSRYDQNGWIEDLPSMQQLRNWHGCGSYTSNEGEQVLIVAGGWDTPNFNILDSVEMLTMGSSAWVFTNPLPRDLVYNRIISMDNTLFMLGGGNRAPNGVLQPFSDIWTWNSEENKWEKVGDMLLARLSHAASVIEVSESLLSNCNY